MESTFFVKGLIAGFVICIPFGPIGLLCVMRTLTDGKVAGIASVLGASVMDAVYCAVAGLGVSYISSFLNKESMVLRLAGGLLLIAMGIKIFFTHPTEKTPEATGHGLLASFGSSFFLMFTNPMAILVFTATFSALGIAGWEDAYSATAILVAGVFVGSSLWAPILVAAVATLKPRLTLAQLRLANRISGFSSCDVRSQQTGIPLPATNSNRNITYPK
ncbi:MAG: LysE family transporter [Syntrophobacteraceae bacterium]|nr:LysE family transporter [Syntrophobacteraceae bacterium]